MKNQYGSSDVFADVFGTFIGVGSLVALYFVLKGWII